MQKDFEWQRSKGGYNITDEEGNLISNISLKNPEEMRRQNVAWWFTPTGKEQQVIKPFNKKGPRRCRQLVEAFDGPDWAESALDFVNEYGLLTEKDSRRAEPITILYRHYDRMKKMLKLYDQAIQLTDGRKRRNIISNICEFYNLASWGESAAILCAESGHFPNLTMQPKSLEHALWLEFAEMMQLGDSWRKCIMCGRWFEPDRKRVPPNKYCTPKCGQIYRNKQRSKKRKEIK